MVIEIWLTSELKQQQALLQPPKMSSNEWKFMRLTIVANGLNAAMQEN